MVKKNAPVLIELEDELKIAPEAAPVIVDVDVAPTGRAMRSAVSLATRPSSTSSRWFWRLLFALVSFGVSIWAWDAVNNLLARNIYLGGAALILAGLFLLVCLGIVLREWAAFSRLRRLDEFKTRSEKALVSQDIKGANSVVDGLLALYRDRPDLAWGRDRISERRSEVFDADGLLSMVEGELIAPLDAAARLEIEAAARQVATVTAIVPLAFADVATALVSNIRMIRRIAEVYGGRSGTIGSWRLTRTVLTHLIATGAVAVGDDLIGSLAGGGVLSKVSRRFGEGVINGALTARVGVAAMDVCRPMPFTREKRPSVSSLVQRALAGLFGTAKA